MKFCYRTAILVAALAPLHFGNEAPAAITEFDLTAADTTLSDTSGFFSLDFIFSTTDVGASGTGTISTFLSLQASPSEQGYNSTRSSGLFDEKNFKQSDDPNDSGTRGMRVNEVPYGTIDGDQYGEFLLDANEGGSASNQELSIYQIQIFAATDAYATDPTLAPTGSSTTDSGIPIIEFAGAEEVFRLSSGSEEFEAIIDASLGSGSGTFDLRFFWDLDLLFNLDLDTYTHLIFYTYMGELSDTEGFSSDGGFDEWSVSLSRSFFTETIPEPSTWALLLMTACGAVVLQYRQQRKQKLAAVEATE